MRKIKEVLRLHYELGLGQRQIARCCSIGQSTVHDYLKRAEAAGIQWPLPSDWDDRQLEERLFGGRPARPPGPSHYPIAASSVAANSYGIIEQPGLIPSHATSVR